MMTESRPGRRHRVVSGPRPKGLVEVPDEVRHIIRIVKERSCPEAVLVEWLGNYVNERLDEELELLATHVLTVEFEWRVPEVQGAMYRGQPDLAFQHLMSRMRRRFAKILRDHQRSDVDTFLDEAEMD